MHAYEIWNEPNIAYWQPAPDPVAYTAALHAASVAIHAADPEATVVTGGTSPAGDGPGTISPHAWLEALYAAGARPDFDAIGHHPYLDSDIGPDSTDPGNPWFQMAGSTPSIRSIQAEHGDEHKRIWATEVGCRRSIGGCEERLSEGGNAVAQLPMGGRARLVHVLGSERVRPRRRRLDAAPDVVRPASGSDELAGARMSAQPGERVLLDPAHARL